MADESINMFAGSYLNRLSWLRPSHSFLNAIVASPQTRWILFKAGMPLTVSSTAKTQLAFLSTQEMKPFIGIQPFFGQGKVLGSILEAEEQIAHTEAIRHLNAPVVFMGLHQTESAAALPSSDFKDAEAAVANLEGTPYFAMDVAELGLDDEKITENLNGTDLVKSGASLKWVEPRALLASLDSFSGSIFAISKSLVDWNLRNKFCAGCGSPTYSMWGGWKISCSSLLPWADNTGRKPCPTAKGLHNFTHPRTDAVVIMIAIDETGEKILLGHNAKFPNGFYSAMAGFIEPGESFEDAVSREMWEEAGVKVTDIKYHSGQPWPYPSTLMVGFYSRADSTKPVRTDLDNELSDAQWFTREQILEVLAHPTGTTLSPRDYQKLADADMGKNVKLEDALKKAEEPPFRIPPLTAIAGVLIRDWAKGKIGFQPITSKA